MKNTSQTIMIFPMTALVVGIIAGK